MTVDIENAVEQKIYREKKLAYYQHTLELAASEHREVFAHVFTYGQLAGHPY